MDINIEESRYYLYLSWKYSFLQTKNYNNLMIENIKIFLKGIRFVVNG